MTGRELFIEAEKEFPDPNHHGTSNLYVELGRAQRDYENCFRDLVYCLKGSEEHHVNNYLFTQWLIKARRRYTRP